MGKVSKSWFYLNHEEELSFLVEILPLTRSVKLADNTPPTTGALGAAHQAELLNLEMICQVACWNTNLEVIDINFSFRIEM